MSMDDGLAIEEVLQEFKAKFSQKSAAERAYTIMKVYFHYSELGGGASEESRRMFQNWLLAPHNEAEKEQALERIFMEEVVL